MIKLIKTTPEDRPSFAPSQVAPVTQSARRTLRELAKGLRAIENAFADLRTGKAQGRDGDTPPAQIAPQLALLQQLQKGPAAAVVANMGDLLARLERTFEHHAVTRLALTHAPEIPEKDVMPDLARHAASILGVARRNVAAFGTESCASAELKPLPLVELFNCLGDVARLSALAKGHATLDDVAGDPEFAPADLIGVAMQRMAGARLREAYANNQANPAQVKGLYDAVIQVLGTVRLHLHDRANAERFLKAAHLADGQDPIGLKDVKVDDVLQAAHGSIFDGQDQEELRALLESAKTAAQVWHAARAGVMKWRAAAHPAEGASNALRTAWAKIRHGCAWLGAMPEFRKFTRATDGLRKHAFDAFRFFQIAEPNTVALPSEKDIVRRSLDPELSDRNLSAPINSAAELLSRFALFEATGDLCHALTAGRQRVGCVAQIGENLAKMRADVTEAEKALAACLPDAATAADSPESRRQGMERMIALVRAHSTLATTLFLEKAAPTYASMMAAFEQTILEQTGITGDVPANDLFWAAAARACRGVSRQTLCAQMLAFLNSNAARLGDTPFANQAKLDESGGMTLTLTFKLANGHKDEGGYLVAPKAKPELLTALPQAFFHDQDKKALPIDLRRLPTVSFAVPWKDMPSGGERLFTAFSTHLGAWMVAQLDGFLDAHQLPGHFEIEVGMKRHPAKPKEDAPAAAPTATPPADGPADSPDAAPSTAAP